MPIEFNLNLTFFNLTNLLINYTHKYMRTTVYVYVRGNSDTADTTGIMQIRNA